MTINDKTAVILAAPAKVNLYLDIGEKRSDGYHKVKTVMHSLALHDDLRMELQPGELGTGVSVDLGTTEDENLDHLDIAVEDNIVTKAILRLAQKLERSCDEKVLVKLHKRIPSQAGLGGGSSDAAAALVGAAYLWGASLDDERVVEVARTLGADVPFFLHGGCVCLTGVGDVFEHSLAPMDAPVVLVKPVDGVSTLAAYCAFDENPQQITFDKRNSAITSTCANQVPLCNNLVESSERLLPDLATVRKWLEKQPGVESVLMSGSGSATFAVCQNAQQAQAIAKRACTQGWWSCATAFSDTGALVLKQG